MNDKKLLEFGSLFSGIGGLDLGLEQAGLKCLFQVENDRHCLTILNRHFPDVPKNEIRPIGGLVGGDPCPIRSHGRRVGKSSSPDLSGYFLAMVDRCRPIWVLRENVPASDVVHFTSALGVLGYRKCVVGMESAAFTGQSRRREFVAGFDNKIALDRFVRACNDSEADPMYIQQGRWTDGIPKSARERTVGNAVTVPVAKWLGERIVEALINNK